MRRFLILPGMIVGLSFLFPAYGEDKKETPKPKVQKIKTAEPTEAAKDPDFAIQGEYVYSENGKKIGLQVVAQGGGQFNVRVLKGGLPGDGWDGKTEVAGTMSAADGKLVMKDKDFGGEFKGGKITLTLENAVLPLKKVDRVSPTLGKAAPEGAVVLFGDEKDATKWNGGNVVKLTDGTFLGVGITSKETFGDFSAHVEFRLAYQPNDRGQGRSNSGFYFQNRYELQVLDSFGLKGENNESGGIYTQHKPTVNMCFPPMVWQTYDVEFKAAKFEGGKKVAGARATVLLNGVKVQDDVEFKKETGGGQNEADTPGAIQLQNHGDPLVYRNIWVLPTKK